MTVPKQFFVPYATWTQLVGRAPLFYASTDDGFDVYAVGDDAVVLAHLVGADASDFSANYESQATTVTSLDEAIILGLLANNVPFVAPRAAARAVAVAAAKGLGGFLPNPSNNPYVPSSEEPVSIYVDGEGSLVARGAVLTDEGSFRNDFSGASLANPLTGTVSFTQNSREVVGQNTLFLSEISRSGYVRPLTADDTTWTKTARIVDDTHLQLEEPYPGSNVSGDTMLQAEAVPLIVGSTPGTLTLDGSGKLLAASGTTGGSGIGLWREADYGPMRLVSWMSISARRAEQKSWFGFRDDPQSPQIFVEIGFEDTDDTKVLFRTGFYGELETTTVTVPAGKTTADQLKYTVVVEQDFCSLQINTDSTTVHELHIPEPYADMILGGAIENLSDTTETTIAVDCVLFLNYDRLMTSGG